MKSKQRTGFLLHVLSVWSLLSVSPGPVQAATVDDFAPRMFTNSLGRLPYRLFVPPNYLPANKYPLVLFLHGAGERGKDNRLQLTGQIGELVFVSAVNQSKHPCFMVAPQCPLNIEWTDSTVRGQVFGILTQLQNEFNVDQDRLYITGLSLGGTGTWDYVTRETNVFAAAVPMSAVGASGRAKQISQMPTWTFHAANDPQVSVSESDDMISALKNAGGNPVYTKYQTGGHAIWTTAYNTPVLVDWVMAQKRSVASTNPPLLTITDPTSDPVYVTPLSTLALKGTASHNGAAITTVMWRNTRNNSSGTATGTNSWSISEVPLRPGITNLIMVSATGTSYSTAYGGNTTFIDSLSVFPDTNTISAPKLLITRSDASVTLIWQGDGIGYVLESSGSLSSPITWTLVDNTPVVAGGQSTIAITPSSNARFYRLRKP